MHSKVTQLWHILHVCARLQSFDDDFELPCELPLMKRGGKDIPTLDSWYKLTGNAVPPLVAQLWGEQILRAAASDGADEYGIDTGKPWQQHHDGVIFDTASLSSASVTFSSGIRMNS